MAHQHLHPALLESLFARLIVAWGREFTHLYEGVEPIDVKADWAEKLAPFQLRNILPDEEPRAPAIAWALAHLPPKAMNSIEFRALCNRYTAPTNMQAIGMKARPVPPQFREAIAKLAEPLEDDRPESVRVAARYVAKFGAAGARPTPFQQENLKHYRRVLERWENAEQRRKAAEAKEAAHAHS